MYRLAKFGVILTAVALLCWPAPTLAGPPVPYKDRVSGQAAPPTGTYPTFNVTLTGKGAATYLGRFTMIGAETLTFDPGSLTSGVVDGTFTYFGVDGKTTNSGTFTGRFTLLATGGRRLDLTVTAQGTGRLAGVTGTAKATVFSDAAGKFTYTSVGTATFP
jgi:hypothetical protein